MLAEAIQTVMRRYGLPDAYEQLKELTRGRADRRETLRDFIGGLPIPAAERQRLLELDPSSYTGLAARARPPHLAAVAFGWPGVARAQNRDRGHSRSLAA